MRIRAKQLDQNYYLPPELLGVEYTDDGIADDDFSEDAEGPDPVENEGPKKPKKKKKKKPKKKKKGKKGKNKNKKKNKEKQKKKKKDKSTQPKKNNKPKSKTKAKAKKQNNQKKKDDQDDSLAPPANIEIVSQTIRMVNGRQLIDVVVDVADNGKFSYTKKLTLQPSAASDYEIEQGEQI